MTVMGTLTQPIRSMIEAELAKLGIELYDIQYRKESNGVILRIYIDSPAGVDSDTCATATRAIKDPIDGLTDLDYDYLEVSSPGIDRILKHERDFFRYQGSQVLVKTSQSVEGTKKFIGILHEVDPEILKIEVKGKLLPINRKIITVVRLHPDI